MVVVGSGSGSPPPSPPSPTASDAAAAPTLSLPSRPRRLLYPLAAALAVLLFFYRLLLMESSLADQAGANVPKFRRMQFWDFPAESEVVALREVYHDVEASVTFDDARGTVRFGTSATADFRTGHDRLPTVFFRGPTFFISGWNPAGHKVRFGGLWDVGCGCVGVWLARGGGAGASALVVGCERCACTIVKVSFCPSFFTIAHAPSSSSACSRCYHGVGQVNTTYNKEANKDLLPILLRMSPRPSKIQAGYVSGIAAKFVTSVDPSVYVCVFLLRVITGANKTKLRMESEYRLVPLGVGLFSVPDLTPRTDVAPLPPRIVSPFAPPMQNAKKHQSRISNIRFCRIFHDTEGACDIFKPPDNHCHA